MADTITDAIKGIKSRRRKLEAELKLLIKAEEALRQIVRSGESTSEKGKAAAVLVSAGVQPEANVSEAICAALKDLGEAESGQIIAHLRAKYLPEVNKNTVRSLLSVWAVKGRVVRIGRKYSLPIKKPQGMTPPI
jgi:hypothetical protein